ncbi:rhodanese-like domain-containing protein [Halobacillus locisalis]|uniref:Rhodanese-like domain-containing protein n=1 Tax=Halobacillus locisalis TaxID=220753 RepID=A0A838CTN7_9BACI|nr:rhodanese-like domain-containing protein [Halobacillus locisalis]MBA2174986.1 rhodanese-like domain-containing protein [Halobacillus locisalis]
MDWIQWGIILAAVWFFGRTIMPSRGISSISGQEIEQLKADESHVFVDVRTPGEYKRQSKKPFQNIPLSEINQRSDELNRNDTIVLLCQSGMRSMKAARLLKRKGFTKLINVKGGINTLS